MTGSTPEEGSGKERAGCSRYRGNQSKGTEAGHCRKVELKEPYSSSAGGLPPMHRREPRLRERKYF